MAGEEGEIEDADIILTEEDLGGDSIEALTPDAPVVAEEAPVVAEEPPAAEDPAPRTPRAENRFQKLTAERDAERARADEATARAEEALAAKQQADTAMIAHWHGRLEVERDSITAQLKQAKVDGDTDTEIALQTRLNTVAQNLATTTEALREAPQARVVEPPASARAPAPAPEQTQVTYQPTTAAWLERNSWFHPQSPDYDQEMGEEARLYAKRVERRFKAEGKPDAIGSAEYFKDIDTYIRQEFPDAFPTATPAAPRAVPPMSRDTTVAPVNRGGAPAAEAPANSRTVRLSADERSFAHQMAANGAFRKGDGTRPTNAEAERLYAAQKLKTAR